ncbi:translation initiation factor eIF-2 beta subunit [Sorochytrium milnesiophthora]
MADAHEPTAEAVFDPTVMKKKKKKTKAAAEPEPEPEQESTASTTKETAQSTTEAAEDELELNFGDKKKKKKKKTKTADEEEEEVSQETAEAAADEESAPVAEDFNFGEKKKKPKKNKLTFAEPAEEEQPKSVKEAAKSAPATSHSPYHLQLDEDDDDDDDGEHSGNDIDMEPVEGDNTVFASEDDGQPRETWLDSDRDYTYQELLARVFSRVRENNPELGGQKRRYTIVPPQVSREGSKKTSFSNIGDLCKKMHRTPEHVIQFMYAELGTTGSVDGAGRLIIRGRFQQKQIESVLRKYIVEYVTCKTCKSPDTVLRKENRLYFMQCESCGSSRSVSAIKTGFQAQTKSRKSQKAKTG